MIIAGNKRNKGFTLIELMVVVSIIGLLSSLGLASLSVARSKARDTNIKTAMNSMRSAGALVFSNTGTYANICSTATGQPFAGIIAGVNSKAPIGFTVSCGVGPGNTRWAASIRLHNGSYYCVDSTNYAGPSGQQSNGTCPAFVAGS